MRVEEFNGIKIYVPEAPSYNEIVKLHQDLLSKKEAEQYESIVHRLTTHMSICVDRDKLTEGCKSLLIQNGFMVNYSKTGEVLCALCCARLASTIFFAVAAVNLILRFLNIHEFFVLLATLALIAVAIYTIASWIYYFVEKKYGPVEISISGVDMKCR